MGYYQKVFIRRVCDVLLYVLDIRIKKILRAIGKKPRLISPKEYEGDRKRNSDDKEEPLLKGC
jgi:hypothetical protein